MSVVLKNYLFSRRLAFETIGGMGVQLKFLIKRGSHLSLVRYFLIQRFFFDTEMGKLISILGTTKD